jgi:hypothetical protein
MIRVPEQYTSAAIEPRSLGAKFERAFWLRIDSEALQQVSQSRDLGHFGAELGVGASGAHRLEVSHPASAALHNYDAGNGDAWELRFGVVGAHSFYVRRNTVLAAAWRDI